MTQATEQGAQPPAPRRAPTWVKALLIASLAVNVAVIGVVVGYKMKDGAERRGESRQIAWIVKLVPDHRRDFALAHFADARREMRSEVRPPFAQMEQILTAVRAEPFAAAQLRAALEMRREQTTRRRIIIHERLISMLQQFNPAERQVFAQNLETRLVKLRGRAAPALSTGSESN